MINVREHNLDDDVENGGRKPQKMEQEMVVLGEEIEREKRRQHWVLSIKKTN